jgi:cell division protein FtsB
MLLIQGGKMGDHEKRRKVGDIFSLLSS